MLVTVSLLLSEVFHQSFGVTSELAVSQEGTKVLAEVALFWVIFADTSRARAPGLQSRRRVEPAPAGWGLSRTIVSSGLLASWSLGVGVWMAVLVGAALAPTDAALGASVMTNAAVPERIRRVLNVESGLDDGIATPVVIIAIAGAAATQSIQGLPTISPAVTIW